MAFAFITFILLNYPITRLKARETAKFFFLKEIVCVKSAKKKKATNSHEINFLDLPRVSYC